ncbi:MAG: hemolysin family protein [Deltaproteobacteria bacterium]|nr:hemolysin family protein [Deltaproteobacteria bacterium]
MEPPPEPWSFLDLAVLILLLVGSFFFAGTETALSSLGEARARALRDRLGDSARALDLWIEQPRRVLTALLLGNNLVNIGATALTTEIALGLFGSAALAIVTGVMTFVVLVFGEITPKTLAREQAERWAVPCIRMLRPFYYGLFPAIWLLDTISLAVSRSAHGSEKPPPVTGEEIDFLIGLGSETGAIKGVKRELLSSVLEFTDLLAKEIMVPRTQMIALDVEESRANILEVVQRSEKSRIPVYQGNVDSVVGVLFAKELLGALREDEQFDLRSLLKPPFFVPEVMKVSRLMKEMQKRHTHMAIVVDEFGGTSGVVTLEDVVEEIVGEIHDETDELGVGIRRLADGHLLVEASTHLRDLEERLEVEFPEEGDYESVGGFITATAGRVPDVGTMVRFRGYAFVVRSADERRVGRVEVFRVGEWVDASPQARLVRPEGVTGSYAAAVARKDGRESSR